MDKKPSQRPSLLRAGLICFLIGLLLNTLFMKLGVGGILRELSRLTTLIGMLMMVFGGIKRLFAKKQA